MTRHAAYLDGFATVPAVLEHDRLTADEIREAFDICREMEVTADPWRRGYLAGIRSAFGE